MVTPTCGSIAHTKSSNTFCQYHNYCHLVVIIFMFYDTDPSDDEVKANEQVLLQLLELEDQFTEMIITFRKVYRAKDFEAIRKCLIEVFPEAQEKFDGCTTTEQLVISLQEQHLHVFNTFALEVLEEKFSSGEQVKRLVKDLDEAKAKFLSSTTIDAFELAVCCRPKHSPSGMGKLEFKLPTAEAKRKTILELQELTHQVFEANAKYLGDTDASSGCIAVSWLYPKHLTSVLKASAKENASQLNQLWVQEVKIDDNLAFPMEKKVQLFF